MFIYFLQTNEKQTLEVGMCLITFFSRSRHQGWTHLFSEMFDNHYWICGKSADGFRCLDLQAIAIPEPEIRRFDQRRCSECLERLVSPQLLSTFGINPARRLKLEQNTSMAQNLELGYKPRDSISTPECVIETEPEEIFSAQNQDAFTNTSLQDEVLEEETIDAAKDQNPEENSTIRIFSNQTPAANRITSKLGLEIESGSDSENPNLTRRLNSTFIEENLDETCSPISSGLNSTKPDTSLIKDISKNHSCHRSKSPLLNSEQQQPDFDQTEKMSVDPKTAESLPMTEAEKPNENSNLVNNVNVPENQAKSEFNRSKRYRILPEMTPSESEDSVISFGRSEASDSFVRPKYSANYCRRKRFRGNGSGTSVTHKGPENVYGVTATVVETDPSVKLNFRHITKETDVCVEINSAEKIKIQNKFGGFVASQDVAMVWLRRHLYVGQVVDINAVLNDNVWNILLVKGEFRMQKPTSNSTLKSCKPGTCQ